MCSVGSNGIQQIEGTPDLRIRSLQVRILPINDRLRTLEKLKL